jgi:hypothetical protein
MTPDAMDDLRSDIVEQVAREIYVRGMTGPAVCFLEASRPDRPLDGTAMLFFDPVLQSIFGGGHQHASAILADETGIELLIDRLEELNEELTWDA